MLDANTCGVPTGSKVDLSSLQKVLLESTDIGYTQRQGRELGEILNMYFGNFRVYFAMSRYLIYNFKNKKEQRSDYH